MNNELLPIVLRSEGRAAGSGGERRLMSVRRGRRTNRNNQPTNIQTNKQANKQDERVAGGNEREMEGSRERERDQGRENRGREGGTEGE